MKQENTNLKALFLLFLWLQILADVFNKKVLVSGAVENSALGAVMVGAEALGMEYNLFRTDQIFQFHFMILLIILFVILLLVALIAWGKINAFLAFLVVSIVAGVLLGIPPNKVIASVQKGITK